MHLHAMMYPLSVAYLPFAAGWLAWWWYVQEQRFSVHAGSVFVLRTDMHMEHIPYADCFRVQSFWRVSHR
jgi:hypothetical protein